MDRFIDSRLREAFLNIKKDMGFLKGEINKIKKAILEENKEKYALKEEIKQLKSFLQENKPIFNEFFLTSTGNKGVFRQFDSTSTVLRQHIDKPEEIERIFS